MLKRSRRPDALLKIVDTLYRTDFTNGIEVPAMI